MSSRRVTRLIRTAPAGDTWHRAAHPLLVAIAVVVLASCSARQPVSAPAPPPVVDRIPAPPVADQPAPADDTPPATMGCDPAPVQALVGRPVDAGLEARARAAAGADMVRVVRPGQGATRDYREGRLTLYVDGDGRLERAHCG